MTIEAAFAQNIHIICKNHGYGQNGYICIGINVNANNVSDTVHIECIVMQYQYNDTKDHTTAQYACSDISLYANNAASVISENIGSYALYMSSIYARHVTSFDIICSNNQHTENMWSLNHLNHLYACHQIQFFGTNTSRWIEWF